jgi:hypothetical protein
MLTRKNEGNTPKNVGNTSEKCWRKNVDEKKCWQTSEKMLRKNVGNTSEKY